jgi:two-component system, sensor histidine kinase RegB
VAVISKELAQDLSNQPEQLQQLEIIRTQIGRCKEILSSITHHAGQSRADAGHGLTLSQFLQEAIQRWRDTRPATELVIDLNNGSSDPLIFTDKTLTQAIQNLLDNAADASPERVLFNAIWDNDTLKIQIRDFGNGLSDEVKKQLGTPFFSSKNGNGMGLGVYLTEIILAKFGGTLTLSNHSEGGVLTVVKLPLHKLRIAH